jgi:uncharacterized lipoprotein YajG
MKLNLCKVIGLFVFLLLLSSGCASTTAKVNLSYAPTSQSPLLTLEPVRVALQVEDNRIPQEKGKVGNKVNGFGRVTASVESNKEVTLVLQEALKNELQNNGHKVVDNRETSHDVFIKVLLIQYWSIPKVRFVDVEMRGTITGEVAIQDGKTPDVLFSKAITGTSRESWQVVLDRAYESVLNGALAEFVRSFSRDPDVIRALQDIQGKATEKAPW